MIADYGKLYDAFRGVTRAEVTSAAPLSDEQVAALKESLRAISGGKDVDLDTQSIRRSSAGSSSSSARAWSTARSKPNSTPSAYA